MPIPQTRNELLDQVRSSFAKLSTELETAGPRGGNQTCIDDWTVKDVLAVRAWWTERVVEWIDAGQRGTTSAIPAEGYSWRQTPQLNEAVVKKSRRDSYRSVRSRLERGYRRIIRKIESLSDRELLEPGVYAWTGKHPIARWISINTTRQYATARTYIRRARKRQSG